MKRWLFLFLPFLLCCKDKATEAETSGSFPVLSFIKSQVAQVDTSLFRITKIVTADSTSDTTYLPREAFREAARDFLSLPDISAPDLRDEYKEERSYDPLLELAVLVYTAKDAAAPVQKEQVFIVPGNGEEDKIQTLVIDVAGGGGRKNLIWTTDSHFQVVAIIAGSGGAEKRVITKVIWK